MSSLTENTPSAQGAVLNLFRRLHFYIGLFVAPFIFVAALTGTLYVLTPQIENVLYADALTVQPQSKAKPLSEQITAARHHAGETVKIYAVRPAPGASDTTRVQFADPALGASESRSVFVDPYTLQIKGDMTVYGTSGVLPLRMWLDQLHRGLMLGDVGRNYSELAASWLWVAALGGVVLWAGTRPRRKVKKATGRMAVTRHWHVTLGLILLGGLVFFSVTGLTWSQWAGSNIDKMRSELNWLTPQVNTALNGSAPAQPADPHADHHAAMDGMDMSGMTMPAKAHAAVNRADGEWDQVLNAARHNGIEAAKVELRQPKSADQAWTVTEVDRSWPSQVDSVSVDPHDFHIVDHVQFASFPLVAKLTRWGVDAHMGVLFGLPNQLILAAFGLGLCVMIVLGYRMWWLRRPAMSGASAPRTLLAAWQPLPLFSKTLSAAILLALGYALPVMGVSLLAFLAIDVIRGKNYQLQSTLTPGEGKEPGPFSLQRKEARHFFTAVALVLIVALTIMTKAMIGGAINEYHIPLSDWSAEMLVTQLFMIAVYSMVFTGLLSIPLWYWFLGENEKENA